MALLSIETYASVLVLHAHYNGTRASRFTRHIFLGVFGPILGERRTEESAVSVWSAHDQGQEEVVSRAATVMVTSWFNYSTTGLCNCRSERRYGHDEVWDS